MINYEGSRLVSKLAGKSKTYWPVWIAISVLGCSTLYFLVIWEIVPLTGEQTIIPYFFYTSISTLPHLLAFPIIPLVIASIIIGATGIWRYIFPQKKEPLRITKSLIFGVIILFFADGVAWVASLT